MVSPQASAVGNTVHQLCVAGRVVDWANATTIMLKPFIFIIRSRLRINYSSMRYFYDANTKNATIFAPASSIDSIKGSPLGIIRISGPRSRATMRKFTLKTPKPRVATLSRLYHEDMKELIDSGLLLWFPKPNSYTGEDVCEFHLHGSRAIMTKMLDLLSSEKGLRPAEPGEFTRRAVKNGKMSLVQAESLVDLIASQTENQRKLALEGLCGSTRDKYQSWIIRLVDILAHLEASIDFGEDELIGEHSVVRNCCKNLQALAQEISNYLESSGRCRHFVQSGFKVVILGKPNAGKSTFMNLLCKKEKSIVSDLRGTTRDIVEQSFDLAGHAISLQDTAGLRNDLDLNNRQDQIEQEGIRRALDAARNADVIIYLMDATSIEANHIPEELDTLAKILECPLDSKIFHLVVNKIDLNPGIEAILSDKFGELNFISCKTEHNFSRLVNDLARKLTQAMDVDQQQVNGQSKKLDYVNERHLALLKSTHRHLERAGTLDIRTIDEMAQHVRESVDYLSRIVGTVSNEQVFDIIFRDFCIGK